MTVASSILGVVLAGGRSQRFGSDKAMALLDGRTLLDHAVATLARHCASVVIAGRDDGGAPMVADWPAPDMGPLGGLCGALRHASDQGFDSLLSCGVDAPGLPDDLPDLLSPAPACFADQPVIGHWPVSTLPVLEKLLAGDGSHAMFAFVDAIGARRVDSPVPLANINRPEDLDALD